MQLTRETGLGVFALRDIPAGTCILTELPLLHFNTRKPSAKCILKRFRALCASKQAIFTDLSVYTRTIPERYEIVNAAKKPTEFETFILSIFHNNHLPISKPGTGVAVYPTAARLNHSCTPNATVSTTTESPPSLVLYANRAINANEELTISYLPAIELFNSLPARHRLLTDRHNLDCLCPACDEKSPNIRKTEPIRDKMALMATCLQDDEATPSLKLRAADELIRLCEIIGLCGEALAFA